MRLILASLTVLIFAGTALSQSPTFKSEGTFTDELFGHSVDRAGDVDADGFLDWAVGSPTGLSTSALLAHVTIFSGRTGTAIHDVVSPQAGNWFGYEVAYLGDIDKDGFDDVGVGAPLHDSALIKAAGAMFVISGKDGSTIYTIEGTSSGGLFGAAISIFGDFNNDTILDFAIGAPNDSTGVSHGGAIRFYDGSNGTEVTEVLGSAIDSLLGWSVSGAGDIDNNGFADILAGAPFDSLSNFPGSAFVYNHKGGVALMKMSGANPSDMFGYSVTYIGDINSDGRDDVVIGIPGDDSGGAGTGSVRAVDGKLHSTLYTTTGQTLLGEYGSCVTYMADTDGDSANEVMVSSPIGSSPYIESISGATGQSIFKIDGSASGFGESVAMLGDVNNDSIEDVGVGSATEDNSSNIASGVVYVYPTEFDDSELKLDDDSEIETEYFPNGTLPADVVRTVNNVGTGVLNWTVAVVSSPSWLQVNPPSGSVTAGQNGDEVTFSFNPVGLAKGEYDAEVVFTNVNVPGNTVTLDVELEVGDAHADPLLKIAEGPAAIVINHQIGGNKPDPVDFVVENVGNITEDLDWIVLVSGSIASISEITPTNSSSNPMTIKAGETQGSCSFSLDPAGLDEGVYTGVLRFANLSTSPTQILTVTVTLSVEIITFEVGDTILGSVGSSTDDDSCAFFGFKGMTLKLKVKANGGSLRPRVVIIDELGAVVRNWKLKKGKATNKKYTCQSSGLFKIRIEGVGETTGPFKVLTSRKLSKKGKSAFHSKVKPDPGTTTASFKVAVLPNAVMHCNIEPLGDLLPGTLSVSFMTPAGSSFDTSAFASTSSYALHLLIVPLGEPGVYTLTVNNLTDPNDRINVPVALFQPEPGTATIDLDQ